MVLTALLHQNILALTQSNIEGQKKPAIINSVQGTMPRKYAIVYTTITNNPGKKDADSDTKPIITRSVLGYINGDSGQTSQYVNKPITIPLSAIEIKSDIPEMFAKVTGAINPKAGLVGGALAVLANEAMSIAGDKLTEQYGNDPITLNLIEILPSKYYRINETTGTVDVTKEFYADFKAFTKLIRQYVPLAKQWNTAISAYNKAYNTWAAKDVTRSDQATIDQLKQMYATSVKPALEAKLGVETQLERFGMHRFAIMPSFLNKAGDSCSAIGYKGPWNLNVYFYIGAKQTNIFNVDFCVKNPQENQQIIVDLIPNQIDPKGNYKAGGLQLRSLSSSDKNPSTTFPVSSGAERVNTASIKSRLLNWYDEMIVQEGADNINSYLIAFDVKKLKDDYQKMVNKKKKKASAKNMAILDKAIASYKGASSDSTESEGQSDEDEDDSTPSKLKNLFSSLTSSEDDETSDENTKTGASDKPADKQSNYYQLLGLRKFNIPSSTDVLKAFNAKKKEFADNETMLAQLKEAFETLSNPSKRKTYDASLSSTAGLPTNLPIPKAPDNK